jgi:hypothetical protein
LSTSTSTGPRRSATAAASSAPSLVGDVPGERLGHPTVLADGVDDLEGEGRIAVVVDGNGQAITREAARDGPAGPTGAPRDEGDAPLVTRPDASRGSAAGHLNDRRVEHRSKVVSGVPSRPTMRAGGHPDNWWTTLIFAGLP